MDWPGVAAMASTTRGPRSGDAWLNPLKGGTT